MWIWPLTAFLTWAAAWGAYLLLLAEGMGAVWAFLVGLLCSGFFAWRAATPWRRVFMVAGFPLSLVASGAAVEFPAWAWLLPLVVLLVLYPLKSWGDAPLFPTPDAALEGLAVEAPLPEGAQIVDAGCGLGAGLIELHRVYPAARIHGLEWSWPLTLACRLRCRFAQVRRADIWAADWSGFDMVYLFQRPESMARAMEKAGRELPAGRWLVSLEFEAVDFVPLARIEAVAGKPVWVYQTPFLRR